MDLRFSQFEIITGAATLVLCLFFVCVFTEATGIEESLASTTREAVDGADLYWAGVEVQGQNVILTGTAPDSETEQLALQRANAVAGVSSVESSIAVIGAAGACQAGLSQYVQQNPIRFKTGKINLADASFASLAGVARILRTCPGLLEVAVHTDNKGDAEINLRLTQRRSEVVAKQLVSQGVVPARLRPVGYGETQPLVANSDDDARRANKRVEIRVTGEPV